MKEKTPFSSVIINAPGMVYGDATSYSSAGFITVIEVDMVNVLVSLS